jgi:molybdopterin biosynthesis enzyme
MEDINKKKIEARLGEGLRMNPEMRHFINASAFVKDGQYWAYPIFKEEGGSFIAMKRANSLIIYPEGKEEIKAGEIVSIQLI